MKQTVLVCGGRNFSNRALVFQALTVANNANPIKLLVHGGAAGADRLAGEWAGLNGVPCEPYPASWALEGRAAGPKRNQRMLDEAKPDLVIAFPGGVGTADMVRRAEEADVPVAKVKELALAPLPEQQDRAAITE